MGLLRHEKRDRPALTTPRLYYPLDLTVGGHCSLIENHLHYICSVQRMKPGSRLFLFDGHGLEYEAVIIDISAERAVAEIIAKEQKPDRPARITLLQALPKAQKMEFIIQKATELGIDEIRPFHSERSIPRLTLEKAQHKTERWRKIAHEAARQCGRSDVPQIAEPCVFRDIFNVTEPDAFKMIFWEEESRQGLKEVLQQSSHPHIFSIIVGPEGGLSPEEVDAAKNSGFIPVSLGKQILKLETAAVAILAILQYEVGLLGVLPDNLRRPEPSRK